MKITVNITYVVILFTSRFTYSISKLFRLGKMPLNSKVIPFEDKFLRNGNVLFLLHYTNFPFHYFILYTAFMSLRTIILHSALSGFIVNYSAARTAVVPVYVDN